ncbi:DUF1093 domain-containing protein [Siminovitchia fordii]|uniref:Uncharacterized protein n=1 Tax=Siminovitchia fordii TaxID=254759 RepID=A0ABQ4K5V8_9BACI|nr:DUF1093 domain-containing protein [Siminovitchia fordii]GIN20538.1 hypothetical protein J1TS3_16720 [Siminovitchia fordii]
MTEGVGAPSVVFNVFTSNYSILFFIVFNRFKFEMMASYFYKQTAFNEKGEAVEVEFSAQKELRQGAFF